MNTQLYEQLWTEFEDQEYRHAYADSMVDSTIATQLKLLREQNALTQAQLAALAEMQQSRISAMEDVNYSSWSVTTLKRLAKAFDCGLEVRFVPFSQVVYWGASMNPNELLVGVSLSHRTSGPTRRFVFGPSRPCDAATTASADCCAAVVPPRSATSRSAANSSPRVRRVTVAPSTRRIYARLVRMTLGFESLCPLAHLACASSAVRVPRAGALPTASFPRRVATSQLLFRSGFRSSRSPEDFHLHVTSRVAFASRLLSASHGASRHAWRTKKKPTRARTVSAAMARSVSGLAVERVNMESKRSSPRIHS